jgi:two-component system heavy metal sensor histidine kinase CusS
VRRRLHLRSISARLALWYAVAATLTLAGLFLAGYATLEHHVVNGLDLLNQAELGEVKAHMVRDYDPNNPDFLERRLRKPTERSGALFYICVHNDENGLSFSSTNLNGRVLPLRAGTMAYNLSEPGLPNLRVGVYRVAPYTITIGTLNRNVDETMQAYAELAFWLLGGMLLASLGIGYGLSRMALRPVRLISETADRIRSDNLSERIPVGQVRDEISDLSRMLNQMFDRIESSFKQVRQFTAEASHELKTPLSLIRLYSEKLLLSGNLGPGQEEILQLQLEELARLDQIIEEMLFLSRVEANAISLNLVHVNPARFLQLFSQDASVLAEHQGCKFAYTHDGEGRVGFDDKRIRQVLLNVLSNALKVTPPGGRVTLRSLLDDGTWRLSMEDEGPGLPPGQHERIFDRFVRLALPDSDSKGSGLGLAICRSIVTMHHGRIFATEGLHGAGLRILIEIPAAGAAAYP